jgi:hypothetical protein
MPQPSAERVARNEAVFRQAAEHAGQRVEDDTGEPFLLFLCECVDSGCTETVALSLDEYEHVRRDSTQFLCAPGHHAESGPWGIVIARRPRFLVVVAEALDAG